MDSKLLLSFPHSLGLSKKNAGMKNFLIDAGPI